MIVLNSDYQCGSRLPVQGGLSQLVERSCYRRRQECLLSWDDCAAPPQRGRGRTVTDCHNYFGGTVR